MAVFVDMQGFRGGNNQFIAKEIAVLYSENKFHHFILTPPVSFNQLPPPQQVQARWLQHNHHGLYWDGGDVSYEEVKFFLNTLRNYSIYVKGEEKRKWLENMLESNVIVRNLEELNCPNLETLSKLYKNTLRCYYHAYHKGSCALQNTLLLNKKYSNYKSCEIFLSK